MRIGTQDVTTGDTYTCDKCDNFTLHMHGLPAMLVAVDHFGAHISGNADVMRNTVAVAARQAS